MAPPRSRYPHGLLQQLQDSIEGWQPPPGLGLSARELVRHLGPQLQHKRLSGWRLADLVTEFTKVGVSISPATLGRYLSELHTPPAGQVTSEESSARPASDIVLERAERPPQTPLEPLLDSAIPSHRAAHIARLNEDV